MSAGFLFVVATPIGALDDITRRAERVLAEADLVVCEDTRRTGKLLAALGIENKMMSYYEPKEERALPKILERLEQGERLALVTDGGTPAISDPGYRLVRAALEAGFEVIPIPGPSAVIAALSTCGLPTDQVTFAGFLPAKTSARKKKLASLADRPDTLAFYESPRRLADLLSDAREILGDREAVIHREITKLYEERLRGRLSELLARIGEREVKGEVVILIGGADKNVRLGQDDLIGLIRESLASGDEKLSEMSARLAREHNWTRKEVYDLAIKIKNEPHT